MARMIGGIVAFELYRPMSRIKRKLSIAYRKAGLALLNSQGRRALDRLGYLSLFNARPADAKPPVWSDLWAIYRQVRERRPKVLLEFGSGCSTIIYAQALADNAAEGAPGFLHSLDADAHWGQVTIASMPGHLRPYYDIILTDPVEDMLGDVPVWRFAEVPDVVPDMIYLDGPALTPERRAAVDILDIEDKFPPGFRLLVDTRTFNCRLLEKHFKRRYQRHHRRILKSTTYDLLPD
ncbi:MAG: hypothetical protein QF603_15305 [Alphaproteobacteria bacterium]|nr:hypothetical protein [Alphaproteobacteria bacterium]HJO89547.1 hypothetical protein [Alphaproteobacteria bacterium]